MSLKTVSGKPIFPVGIGTWGIGGSWEADYDNDQQGIDGIRYCVSKGQNHIDSGQIYGAGHTDEVIGQAIKTLKREDLFITDKVWETHVAKGKVKIAVDTMLKKLGTDYIDMLYIHKPWEDFPWREAVPQINELIDKGVVRHFGVSNFNLEHMQETVKLSKHPIAANQLYYNALRKQDIDNKVKDFCKKHGIQIIAYRPLERGEVLKNEVVRSIAKAHNASASQIALAWLIQQGMWVIPMATDPQYIDENIKSVDIKLSAKEIAQLDSL